MTFVHNLYALTCCAVGGGIRCLLLWGERFVAALKNGCEAILLKFYQISENSTESRNLVEFRNCLVARTAVCITQPQVPLLPTQTAPYVELLYTTE